MKKLFRIWLEGKALWQIAEATKDWPRPLSEAEVWDEICAERGKLAKEAKENIVKRARAGEVAAVDWLERRGFISLPKANSVGFDDIATSKDEESGPDRES